jgi:hypothetical protein
VNKAKCDKRGKEELTSSIYVISSDTETDDLKSDGESDKDNRFDDDELWLNLPSTQQMIKNRIKPQPSKFLVFCAKLRRIKDIQRKRFSRISCGAFF